MAETHLNPQHAEQFVCANFESATIRDKMNAMAPSPYVEAAMCAGL